MDLERSQIAAGLRRLREENDFTQEYVGEVLKNKGYSKIEQGKYHLKFDEAYKLAQLYKVPMEHIMEPKLRDKFGNFEEKRSSYGNRPELSMTVTLDGKDDTLKKQIELITKVNAVLAN